MTPDPEFPEILVHDDAELGAMLGSAVVTRRLVHRWPLSRTERVDLADGRAYAYKAQLPPTVEAEFYAAAASGLLLPARDLGRYGRTRFLAIEWSVAGSLHSAAIDDREFVGQARRVNDRIAAIEGPLPVHLDISTPATLAEAVDVTVGRLEQLVNAGRFALPRTAFRELRAWAAAASGWLETAPTGLAHGDLSPEEVLLVDEGFRVLDWQRPVRGPVGLDLVSLLRFRKLEPEGLVHPEVVRMSWFLLLHWAALAATELLPHLDPALPESWARMSLEGIL